MLAFDLGHPGFVRLGDLPDQFAVRRFQLGHCLGMAVLNPFRFRANPLLVFSPGAGGLFGDQCRLLSAERADFLANLDQPLVKRSVWKIEAAWDLGRVFFAAQDYIGYVDAKGGEAKQIATGNAQDLVYEPTKHEIYASFARTAEVQVFDARTGTLAATISLPGWNASELESVPGKVFCLLGGKDGIYAIDANTHRIAAWPVDGRIVTPGYLEADPGGRTLFMARDQEIDAIDVASAKVTGRVTMLGTAAIGFDPGTGFLLATWDDPNSTDYLKVVALRPDANGLTEVERLRNPSIGGIGVEPTQNGFIQAGNHALLVWSSALPAPVR